MKLIITEKGDKRARTAITVTAVEVDTARNTLMYVMKAAPNSICAITMETDKEYHIRHLEGEK